MMFDQVVQACRERLVHRCISVDVLNQYTELHTEGEEELYVLYIVGYACWHLRIPHSVHKLITTDIPFLKRCYARILLLSNGWDHASIEEFIKNTLQTKKEISPTFYTRLRELLQLPTTPNKRKKGRPPVPSELKDMCKEAYARKNKEKMSNIYEFYFGLSRETIYRVIRLAQHANDTELETTFNTLLSLK
jgi:hypothetical protein